MPSSLPRLACLAAALLLGGGARADEPAPAPAPPPPPTVPAPPAAPTPPVDSTPPAAPSPTPAADPAKAVGPKAVVEPMEHDFGVVKQETELKTEFTLRNEGTSTLSFEPRADCGCSAATTDTNSLEPGESTKVRVLFRTFAFVGPVTKRIRLVTREPDHKTIVEMKIKADVSSGVVVDPARFFFGPVEIGAKPSLTLKVEWKEGVGTPFRITSTEVPGVDLELTTKPFDAPPWHGYEVTAAFRTPPPVGTVSGTAIIRTDSKDAPRITAAVTAFVSGKVWLDRREVSLGMLREGKERAVMVGCRALKPGVELGDVTAKARGGKVNARAIRSGSEWVIEIQSPETAKPGRLDDVVEVTCGLPGEKAEIAVTGEVLAKQG